MTRDELILVDLLGGERSTVDLATATGLSERVCRYGLHRLIGQDYVWSPARGRYRLTHRGLVIAAEITPDAEPSEVSGTTPAQSATERPRRRLFGRSRE
jgi:predicted transcriptional regulator